MYFDYRTWRPLVVVSKGELLDPSVLIGLTKLLAFQQRYVSNVTYSLYAGRNRVGTLSNLALKETHTCDLHDFLPVYQGHGTFRDGKEIPGAVQTSSVSNPKGAKERKVWIEWPHAIAIPGTLNSGEENITNSLNAQRMRDIEGDVERKLVPQILKLALQARLNYAGRDMLEVVPKSYITWLMPASIRSRNSTDVIGQYFLLLRDTETDERFAFPFIFASLGNGNLDVVTAGEMFPPYGHAGTVQYRAIGVLDFDGDGKLEIILARHISHYDYFGIRIEVLRRGAQQWEIIYRSNQLGCGSPNSL